MTAFTYHDAMHSHPIHSANTPVKSTEATAAQLQELVGKQAREIAHLRRQVEWFQRQVFGQKSERRMPVADSAQGVLGEGFMTIPDAAASNQKRLVAGHERELKPKRPSVNGDESTLFFDEAKVPVEVIHVANPEAADLSPDEYEVIGEKASFRLAQRPGSYVVLKYVRPVIKRRDTQALSCPPAPSGVIDGSRADVSFIAGMTIDKFCYHQPLYRQHQRLRDSHINVSRSWLTQLMQKTVTQLEPIFDAQLDSVRASRVKAMDETPLKAGLAGPGKMRTAYIWPVYGELDEICFLYSPSRSGSLVQETFGLSPPKDGVLLSDGYEVYAQYAKKAGLTHAQCWAHARRTVFEAKDIEPAHAERALEMIGALYAVEAKIRDEGLTGLDKRARRQGEAKPVATRLFAWIDQQFETQGFLPSNPFLGALGYIRERREGLEVYLDDPEVQIDTNHLERALRVIPMGRKNWMFTWTELGAKHVGIVQSLLVTCRLHDINPYEYLVDVLQRVGQHPASRVHELTPRLWKKLFANNPLRSDLR